MSCWRHWWKLCVGTFCLPANYTRMTFLFRCWHPGWVRPKPGGCGPTCATIALQETTHPLQCGSRIPRIARASIRNRA